MKSKIDEIISGLNQRDENPLKSKVSKKKEKNKKGG
jgi:hypothetical protein